MKWGMSDALATEWITSAASVWMTGPSHLTMFALFCMRTISFTPIRTECTGHATWTSSLVFEAAVLACFLVGIMLRRFRYRLSNVKIFKLATQSGGLHTIAVSCYQFYGPLFLCIFIHRLGEQSWCIQALAFGDYGLLRFIRNTFSRCSP